jgi:hypothetical protein
MIRFTVIVDGLMKIQILHGTIGLVIQLMMMTIIITLFYPMIHFINIGKGIGEVEMDLWKVILVPANTD